MVCGANEDGPTVARAEWHTGTEFLPEYTYTPHGIFCIDAGLRAGAALACDGCHIHLDARRHPLEALYYKLIAVILLFPWALVGLTTAGFLWNRWRRNA